MAGATQTIFQGTLTATGARQAGHEKLGVGSNWIGHHLSDQGNSEELVEVADKGGMISGLMLMNSTLIAMCLGHCAWTPSEF
jgi:hypothetical protein